MYCLDKFHDISKNLGHVVLPLQVVCLVLIIFLQMRDHYDISMYLNGTPTIYYN